MKTLYLVRHAKSSWDDSSLSDQQRPLNKRGHTNAPVMGRRLADKNVAVDLITSSPALRAITTARYLANEIAYKENDIKIEPELYFSGRQTMLELIKNTDSVINSQILVGHNPDMTHLLNFLCGHQTHNMQTCALASIEFKQGWQQIGQHSGTLIHYDYPKKVG